MSVTIDGNHRNIGVSNDMETILSRMKHAYEAQGWSYQLYLGDSALLKRVGKHPDDAELQDLERVVILGKTQGTRANYVARLKSMYTTLRRLNMITSRVDENLPTIRKPRSVPKPLTDQEALILMTEAQQPYRDWFILGCRGGLRAMEANNVRGEDLSNLGNGKYELRILGKNKTDITVPVHKDIADIFERRATLDYFWRKSSPRKLSTAAGIEMRRLGVSPSRARFHSCRHYFATSVLEASGWDLLTTAKLMRHASVATTQGYAQLRDDRPREVLSML